MQDHATETPIVNRYKSARRNPDYTIDQDWASYTTQEHDRWDRLFARSRALLHDRACAEFLAAIDALELSKAGIPDMDRLSDRLQRITGWRVVPVTDLVPDDIFFEHLANRRFPAGAFIRPEQQLDYLEEPDIFHDIFGHVPLLANKVYADFMEACGRGGQRALKLGRLANLARLYWYTVEFGLIRAEAGLRIFGAGIMSSATESVFALESDSPNRVAFDLERVMRTNYIIDDFQQTYFVIDSFESLLEACYRDFGPLYGRLATAGDIAPDETIPGDRLITRGTSPISRTRAASSPASHDREFGVLAVGHQHAARIMGDAEFGLHGRDDRLRRHPAGPEHRNLVVIHRCRVAVVGLHDVLDADQLRLADVHRRAVHGGKPRRDLDGADRVGGLQRPHRHHQGPAKRARGGGLDRGAIHRHRRTAGDVAELDAVLHQRVLE
jgi:phenylalanine-4-hydroxylase